MKAQNGTLQNWTQFFGCIYGELYNDPTKRFKEGGKVKTSTLQNPVKKYKEGDIVETMNSSYLLGICRRK